VSLPGLLTRNWPLKLAALALSIILWVLVASEETSSELVSVQVDVDLPPDLALAKPAPPLRALVTGPGRELIKLYATPLAIRASVPNTAAPPAWRLNVAPPDIQVPRAAKVTIQDVEPRSLELSLDRLVQRDVPVALRALVEPESGFALEGRLTVTPSAVRVAGARVLVAMLDSFPTEPIEIRGITERFERTVALDTARAALVSVMPRTVTVSGRVRAN
jgi:YbbR domain-containing protein